MWQYIVLAKRTLSDSFQCNRGRDCPHSLELTSCLKSIIPALKTVSRSIKQLRFRWIMCCNTCFLQLLVLSFVPFSFGTFLATDNRKLRFQPYLTDYFTFKVCEKMHKLLMRVVWDMFIALSFWELLSLTLYLPWEMHFWISVIMALITRDKGPDWKIPPWKIRVP